MVCAAMGFAVAIAPVATASAARHAKLSLIPPPQIAPTDAAVVNASVPARSSCQLRLQLGKKSVKSRRKKATERLIQFTWTVPANARPGAWRAQLTCTSGRHHTAHTRSVKLNVAPGKLRHRPGHGLLAHAIRMTSLPNEPPLQGPAGGRQAGARQAGARQAGATGSSGGGWGAVLVRGDAWRVAGASGRDCGLTSWPCGTEVRSNGPPGNPYWPYSPGAGLPSGIEWQCVELVNRFLEAVGWYRPGIAGNGVDLWSNAPHEGPNAPFVRQANGSGYRPVPGDIVVYSGLVTGHVAIVESDDGTNVGMLEQNIKYGYGDGRSTAKFSGNTLVSGYSGLTVIGFLHARANTVAAPPAPPSYHITANAVSTYAGPGANYPVKGHLNAGDPVTIGCQRRSNSVIKGSAIWDHLSDGTYVADYYVSTPAYNQFSPDIPQCPPPTGRGLGLLGNGSGYVLDSFGGLHPVNGTPGENIETYWDGWDIARAVAVAPNGHSGYVLDGYGGIHPFGGAPNAGGTAYWPGWDIARAITLRSDGHSGYVMDGYGGIHPFGGAPSNAGAGAAYWPGWDIARAFALRTDGQSGYQLDGYGGIHPFGGAPNVGGTAYWPGWDIARSIAIRPNGQSGYVLDGYGAVHPFGGAPSVAVSRYTPPVDDARTLVLDTSGNGGWVLYTDGGVAQFGDAPAVSTSWHP